MNPYNKISTILILLVLLGSVSSFSVYANAYSLDSPNLKLLLEEVTPEPVEPGQDVTVKIRIINEGGRMAKDVSINLNTDFPFYLKTRNDNPNKTTDLCVACSIDSTYYLVVDTKAKSGIYPLNFEILSDNAVIKPSETINIKIVGKPDVLLQTENIEVNAGSGEKFRLDIQLDNIGTGIARNIKLIPESDDIMMIGSNIKFVREIMPDKKEIITSEFIIKASLEPDTYKFPIRLEYFDELGNVYNDSFDIGINVLHRADIAIKSIKINPSNPVLHDSLYLEGMLENTGKGEANKVAIELIIDNKTYKAFVGQLKADDDAPFYFEVKLEQAGTNKLELKISYYDDFGFHELETTLEKDVKRPKYNAVTIIILLVLFGMLAGYFIFIRKKAKK